MLTEIYTEALLVDEELADQVCEAWDSARTSGGGTRFVDGSDHLHCKSVCVLPVALGVAYVGDQ